ncbi:MAG: hypothetical protein ER33_02095 [Cyanobium sp. CACIAM 14]|nr:MAG: hypothetical protein ER33_02095 [Cyanobium sp. CACIAM 14]
MGNLALFASGLLLGGYLANGYTSIDHALKNAAYELDPSLFNRKRVLVLGTDQSSGSTDVMFTVESDGAMTEIEQIPRDTMVQSGRFGVVKANALYALGGAEAAEDEVSRLIHGKIDHFARVNLEGVRRAGDALDGIEVNVPVRMKYDDYSQNLHIDLYPGRQVLKGAGLEGFIRFRHDGLGDIGRMERQRVVFNALFEKILSPGALVHLPDLIRITQEDVKTDLSPMEIGALLGLMKGNHLKITRLEGRPVWYKNLSFWLPSEESLPL